MDKQAYHYNKKKLKGKTPGTYLYFYPCDPSDNPDKWIEGKAYAVIEVTEREWQILFAFDREEYNDDHAYVRKFTPLIYSKNEEELTPYQRQKRIGNNLLFDEASNDKADIRRAMKHLTTQEQEVYSLVHFEDMRQTDIAKQWASHRAMFPWYLNRLKRKLLNTTAIKLPTALHGDTGSNSSRKAICLNTLT